MRKANTFLRTVVVLSVLLIATLAWVTNAVGSIYAFILVGSGNVDLSPIPISDQAAFHGTATKVKNALESGWGLQEGQTLKFACAWRDSGVEVFTALTNMTEKVTEDDVFLFYYIGHGAKGDAAAMMPWFASDTSFTYDSLNRNFLSHVDGKKVVILDACYAGRAHNELSPDTWLLTSCGNEKRWGAVYEAPFSTGLAAAIKRGDTSLYALFEAGNQTFHFLYTPQWYPAEGQEDIEIVPTSNEEDLCRGLADIQSALFQFWSADETLMAQYGKAAYAKSQTELEMACRQIINLNAQLAKMAGAVVQALRTAGYASLAETVRQAKDQFTNSPYKVHAEEWIKGNIQLGYKLFGQRGTALGVLFDSIHKVENEMCIRCPSFDIHPWSH